MREMIVFVVCCNVRLRRRPLQHAKLSGACLTKITVRGSCLNSEILKKLICLKIPVFGFVSSLSQIPVCQPEALSSQPY